MPWKASDATKHTRLATTKARQSQWARVANATLKSTGDEGRAIRTANATLKPARSKKR